MKFVFNGLNYLKITQLFHFDSEPKIHFEQIKTNSTFRETNSGFINPGLGV